MRRLFNLFGILSLGFLFALETPAWAVAQNVVIGEACQQLGVSTMTTNQKDIAVCLKDDTGALKWKSGSGGSGEQGSLCGFAHIYYDSVASGMSDSGADMSTHIGGTNVIPCNGQGVLNTSNLQPTCPAGYSAVRFPPAGYSLNANGPAQPNPYLVGASGNAAVFCSKN